MRRFVTMMMVSAAMLVSAAGWAKGPEERVQALEQQIQALQRTYMANNADTASAVERVRAMSDEFNAIKGQVEANTQILRSQHEELMRLIQDLQSRVSTIEDRMGVFSSQVTSAIGQVNPQAGAEAQVYQQAMDMATSGRYLEAAAGFESFLQKYPKSQFAPTARFWVAESFFLSRDYKRAIKEYQVFVEKYPKDAKVADAILKQGNSFYELGMVDEARAFYDKLLQSYPKSKEAQQARGKINRIDERKGGGKGGTSPAGASPPESGGGSGQTSYPSETIEQQRARISGQAVPQPQAPKPAPKTPALPRRDSGF